MIFWRKIVIFHEIPQKFSRLPPLGANFLCTHPQLKILDPPLKLTTTIYM
jgi:hypothetical protein